MGQAHGKQVVVEKPATKPPSINSFKPKKHLTKVEIVSLQHIFIQLKSTFPDGFTCVETKKFLEHLNFPQEVEPAAILLFKSFSYLGSYPNCTTAGPVHLSFDAFITAFVVMIGRLDEFPASILSESLFLQSLSIMPIPVKETVIVEQPKDTTDRSSKGLSLAELGVDFNDLDFNTKARDDDDNDDGSKILCRDLVELFVLLLWLGESDLPTHDFKCIRQMAVSIVNNIKPSSDDKELPCISNHFFRQWKDAFSPHLFKPIQSLITKSFTYCNSDKSKLLPPDKVPTTDASDILTPLYSTMLSWTLPGTILITKQWTRLYSADQDGFSMNRFESHVFKYPGPTLLIMQVSSQGRPMTLGAFITQPWKQSKHFWGSSECFLFELDPQFDIFRSKPKTENYIYYHHDFGIGFGANENHASPTGFIMYLQNTLQEGLYQNEAYPSQPTFESATKNRKHTYFTCPFDTENIEVFGLGNEKDRERQAREWKFDQNEAERRNGLNIRNADGNLDKELLKMAGIIDERQER